MDYGAGRGDAGGFSDGSGADDDDDDGVGLLGRRGQIDREYIDEMHFGGGLELKKGGGRGEEDSGPRSKKDVLEEMIARSKEQKRERQQRKEEQVDGVDQMDADFGELAALLDFRGKDAPKPALDAFEKEVRAMNFETRSKPSDRKKTDEEIAAEELEKMQKLERKRLRRMNGVASGGGSDSSSSSDDDDDDDDEGDNEAGGKAKGGGKAGIQGVIERRNAVKVVKGKKIQLTDEEIAEGYSVDPRTGILMPPPASEDDEDAASGEEEDDDESDESDDDEDDDAAFDESDEDAELASGSSDDDAEEEEEDDEDETTKSSKAKEPKEKLKKAKKASGGGGSGSGDGGLTMSMPYVIDPPRNAAALQELIDQYATSPAEVAELIRRIRVTSPIALDQTGRNRLHMHNLYDALLRRLVLLGDDLHRWQKSEHLYPTLKASDDDDNHNHNHNNDGKEAGKGEGGKANANNPPPEGQLGAQLDRLSVTVYEMTQELGGDTVCALWRRYLTEAQRHLTKRLREDAAHLARDVETEQAKLNATPSSSPSSSCSSEALQSSLTARLPASRMLRRPSCWPSRGELLLLKQLATVFPTSDFRHGVTTPAHLLVGQALAQCPVRSPHDLVSGLLCSANLLQYTTVGFKGGTCRVAPESLAFLRSVLLLFSAAADAADATPAEEEAASSSKKKTKKKKKEPEPPTQPPTQQPPPATSLRLEQEHVLLLPTFATATPLSLWLSEALPFAGAAASASSTEREQQQGGGEGEGAASSQGVPPLPLARRAPPLPPPRAMDVLDELTMRVGADGPASSSRSCSGDGSDSPFVAAFRESAEADDGNDRSVPPASLVEAGDFAAACLGAALRLIVKAVAAYKQSAAFYELFEPIAVALVGLTPSSTSGEEVDEEEEEEKPKKKKQKKKQPPPPKKKKKKAPASKARPFAAGSPLGALFEEARGAVTEGVERCLKHRVPMQWQSTTVADEALESLAPKYEARYDGTQKAQRGSAAQADAAEEKKLLKALKREQKGAARELRRDAEYLARARDDERDRVSGAKQEERHKNFAWLQDQQASLNQQVRKGGAMVTGGGSSIKRSASAVLKSGRRMK